MSMFDTALSVIPLTSAAAKQSMRQLLADGPTAAGITALAAEWQKLFIAGEVTQREADTLYALARLVESESGQAGVTGNV